MARERHALREVAGDDRRRGRVSVWWIRMDWPIRPAIRSACRVKAEADPANCDHWVDESCLRGNVTGDCLGGANLATADRLPRLDRCVLDAGDRRRFGGSAGAHPQASRLERAGERALTRAPIAGSGSPGHGLALPVPHTVVPDSPLRQPAAFRLTPLRSATELNLVFAAFSSFKLVVRKRTMSSCPSSSAQAIKVP
jgi:hypothetical protein